LGLLLLCGVHLRQRFGKLPTGAAQNGKRHLQIALDLFGSRRLRRLRLPLGFQKQFRFGENALSNHTRAFAPGCVKLRRLPGIAAVLHERLGHSLAVFGTDARHRHQILHGDLRCDVSFAHISLDRFRQQLDKGQPPRHPTHTSVETASQFVERVTEAMFHLRQQPALFERAFLRAHSLRTR